MCVRACARARVHVCARVCVCALVKTSRTKDKVTAPDHLSCGRNSAHLLPSSIRVSEFRRGENRLKGVSHPANGGTERCSDLGVSQT